MEKTIREQIKASNAFLFIPEAIQEVEKMQEPECKKCKETVNEDCYDETT